MSNFFIAYLTQPDISDSPFPIVSAITLASPIAAGPTPIELAV